MEPAGGGAGGGGGGGGLRRVEGAGTKVNGKAGEGARVRVKGQEAQIIAELWRKLPAGEPARCHMPPYGLRFWQGEKMVCQASVCWACNNLYGNAGDEAVYYAFDAKRGVSKKLLDACKR